MYSIISTNILSDSLNATLLIRNQNWNKKISVKPQKHIKIKFQKSEESNKINQEYLSLDIDQCNSCELKTLICYALQNHEHKSRRHQVLPKKNSAPQ